MPDNSPAAPPWVVFGRASNAPASQPVQNNSTPAPAQQPPSQPPAAKPLAFDVQGALAAGYSPEEITSFMALHPNSGFDVQGAMKAGYTSQEIVDELAKMPVAPAPSAAQDPPWVAFRGTAGAPSAQIPPWEAFAAAKPQTTTSPLAALRNSAGAIVSGVGNLGQAIDQGIQNNLPAPVAKALGATGDLANGTNQAVVNAGKAIAGPQQFDGQAVHRFMTDAGNGNVGGAAYDALGAAASIAPIAATAAVPYLGPAALAAQGAGNTIAAREQATGESAPSAADALAGTASAALNLGLGPASAGVIRFVAPTLGKIGSTLGARALLRTALAGGAGATTGAGNYALDTAGTGNVTAAGALNAAVEGAGTGTLAGAFTSPADPITALRSAAKAGPNIRAYAAETAPWNSAFQQATQAVQDANPNLSPDEVRSAAYVKAQGMDATPPTFTSLSPSAQRGLAQLGVLQMYQQRLQLAAAGAGKDPSSIAPSTVFKDVLGDITRNLTTTSSLLKQAGLINQDQAQTLNSAIAEARQGNRNPGDGGPAVGYFSTLRDQVNALPIDPAYRNTISMMLRMADEAEDNSWKQGSMGPLERNAGIIGPALGLAVGGLIAPHFDTGLGMEGIEGLGGLIGMARHGMVKSTLRGLDTLLGTQRPPILQNQAAIEDYAARNGLTNPVTPGDLIDIQNQLRGLANTVPPGPAQAAQAARLRAANMPPVTSNPAVRQPMARLSRLPNQQAPAAAPQRPLQAPQGGPVSQVAALHQALQGAATANDAAIMKAFPVAGTTWQRAIANNTGLPLQAIQDHMQGLVDAGQLPAAVHSDMTSRDFLPVGQYGRLNDYFANMAGQPTGNAQGNSQAQVDPATAIRLAKYRAAVQTANTVHANIAAQNPDLAPIANFLAGVKVAEDRGTVLDHYLAGVTNPAEKARQEAILRPLTAFGWKPGSGSPDPRGTDSSESLGGPGARLRNAQQMSAQQ